MSGPQFTLLVRNRIPESVPDDSIETISVGGLRKAAADMAELYEALAALVDANIKCGPFYEPLGSSEQTAEVNAAVSALAKARGETQ